MPSSIHSLDRIRATVVALLLGLGGAAGAQPAAGGTPPQPPTQQAPAQGSPQQPGSQPQGQPQAPEQQPPPAQPPQDKPPADAPVLSPEERARAEFEKGQTQYDLGRFDGAIHHYARAYEQLPLPAFLFNIAQSHRQLGRNKEAAFFYRRYLDLAQNPPNAPLAKQLLAEVETAQGLAPSAEDGASSPSAPEPPLYQRRWVWFTLAGVVAASATAATFYATRPERTTLGTVDGR